MDSTSGLRRVSSVKVTMDSGVIIASVDVAIGSGSIGIIGSGLIASSVVVSKGRISAGSAKSCSKIFSSIL